MNTPPPRIPDDVGSEILLFISQSGEGVGYSRESFTGVMTGSLVSNVVHVI